MALQQWERVSLRLTLHTPSAVAVAEARGPPGTFLSLVWLQLEKLVWVLHVDSLAGLRACGEGSF